jgi:hypothetical protein
MAEPYPGLWGGGIPTSFGYVFLSLKESNWGATSGPLMPWPKIHTRLLERLPPKWADERVRPHLCPDCSKVTADEAAQMLAEGFLCTMLTCSVRASAECPCCHWRFCEHHLSPKCPACRGEGRGLALAQAHAESDAQEWARRVTNAMGAKRKIRERVLTEAEAARKSGEWRIKEAEQRVRSEIDWLRAAGFDVSGGCTSRGWRDDDLYPNSDFSEWRILSSVDAPSAVASQRKALTGAASATREPSG